MDIKVYGTDTSGHKLVIAKIRDFLLKAKITFRIIEITEIAEFLKAGVNSIPAIQLNDEPIIGLKSNGSFSKSLRDAINHILETENYGAIPKIVLPIDFSDTSINALAFGHRLATDMAAVTKVVHIYDPTAEKDTNPGSSKNSEEKHKSRFNRIVKGIDSDWGSDILKASLVSSVFEIGSPVKKIQETIKNNSGKLVIMGATGLGHKPGETIGEVSAEIAKNIDVPVLLIPRNARYKGINNVMLVIENQPIQESYVNFVYECCSQLGTQLHIAHINNEQSHAINEESIRKQNPSLDLQTHQLQGEDVILLINHFIKENSIDIVSLSRHNRTLFDKVMQNNNNVEEVQIDQSVPLLLLNS